MPNYLLRVETCRYNNSLEWTANIHGVPSLRCTGGEHGLWICAGDWTILIAKYLWNSAFLRRRRSDRNIRAEVFALRRNKVLKRRANSTPILYSLILLVVAFLPNVGSGQNSTCGLKPFPKLGCSVGRCVDGTWEQVCDKSPEMSCGFKPFPKVGCRIGRCVDGTWEQVCDNSPEISCGLMPFPKLGCQIGRCIDGRWEQVCK